MLVYEDNHSLMTDPVEIDHIINGALWFMEHNSNFFPAEPEVTETASAEAQQEEQVEEKPAEKVEKKEEKKEEKIDEKKPEKKEKKATKK